MSNFRDLIVLVGVLVLIQPATLQTARAEGAAVRPAGAITQPALTLAAATSWGYQLQSIEPTVLTATPYDVRRPPGGRVPSTPLTGSG